MLKEATAANDADRMSMENYAQLRAIRDARRRNNKVRRLHHHAVRTDDMEATRRFYEDLLGMPMVAAMRGLTDRHFGGGTPFLHCFFELGDGSSLAFFQFAPETSGPADKLPPDGIDHHIAVSVPAFDEIARLKSKFDALGYLNCGIDHGFCYSLYVRDPNGMLLELVGDAANELELTGAGAEAAHDVLAQWSAGDYSRTESSGPATPPFPLPTSPVAEIARVIRGAGQGEPPAQA
jgi:glyoxylase I family protein